MSSFSFNQLTEPTCYADPTAPNGFDPAIAYVLGQCCALSYDQYAKYPDKLAASGTFEAGEKYHIIGEPFMTSESIGTGSTPGTSGDYRTVPIGFALQCTPASGSPYNVVTLRGTRTYSEWISDAEAFPAPFRVGTNNGDGYDDSVAFTATYGSVHGGFYNVYTTGENGTKPVATKVSGIINPKYAYSRPTNSAAAGVEAALQDSAFDPSLPLYVTGHSLGAGLAVIAAMDIGVNMSDRYKSGDLSMINLAGPLSAAGIALDSVAVPLFGQASEFTGNFAKKVNNAWRIVNAADIVPILPPESLSLELIDIEFAHVTENNVTFCAQTGSIGGNHSMDNTYLPYLKSLAANFA